MFMYIRWQKCQIYIVPAQLRNYKYIYNIVKVTVTLNIKFRNPFTLNQWFLLDMLLSDVLTITSFLNIYSCKILEVVSYSSKQQQG